MRKTSRKDPANTQAEIRARILDAALRLVASGGANELTQPKVSRAAGLLQSHLTYSFPTRADLLQAVAQHSIEALVPNLPKKAGQSLSDLIAAGSGEAKRTRLMLALVGAADRDPSIRRRLRRFILDIRRRIGTVLEARGTHADARELAFLHSVVVGTAVLQLARRNAESRREARHVLRRAFDCLAADK